MFWLNHCCSRPSTIQSHLHLCQHARFFPWRSRCQNAFLILIKKTKLEKKLSIQHCDMCSCRTIAKYCGFLFIQSFSQTVNKKKTDFIHFAYVTRAFVFIHRDISTRQIIINPASNHNHICNIYRVSGRTGANHYKISFFQSLLYTALFGIDVTIYIWMAKNKCLKKKKSEKKWNIQMPRKKINWKKVKQKELISNFIR